MKGKFRAFTPGVLLMLAASCVIAGVAVFHDWHARTTAERNEGVRSASDADGYSAGVMGQPSTACPYTSGANHREAWLKGWLRGDAERRKGEKK